MKSFVLFGGSDTDREALASLIRELYGHIVPVELKLDPGIDELATSSGIQVHWVIEPPLRRHRNPVTGTPGSGQP